MSVDYSKIIEHPDKEEIISKIMTGTSSRDIGDWLKLKYPTKEQSHLRLSTSILDSFKNNNVDLYNTLRNDLATVKNGGKISKNVSASIKNNKTYQERLNEIADKELDIKKVITETIFLIQARLEQMFDIIQNNPENAKPDHTLIKWFETLLNATEKYQKIFQEPTNGSVVNNNITVNLVEQHSVALQEAIRDTMNEIDPELAFLFMDKLNAKLLKLKPEEEKIESQEKRLTQITSLKTKVEKDSDAVFE